MTLHEWWEKINSRDFFFAAVVVLVGFASFGLGRLSLLDARREPVRIEDNSGESASVAAAAPAPLQTGGEIVASKTGAKYFFPWCAGAAAIAEKNKKWFASIEEARKAGYTPAGNCKGLQ